MKILVIGSKKTAEVVEVQMVMAGHSVGHVPDGLAAAAVLKRDQYDVILLIDCDRLEETDLVAEALKQAAQTGPSATTPYVFVLWGAVFGFELAGAYGLKAIDIMIEDCSPRQCEYAYRYAVHNQI